MKPPPPRTEPPSHFSARAKFDIDTEAPGFAGTKQAPKNDLSSVPTHQVTAAESRAKILEAQREAALRRRSMQMRSAVITRADRPAARSGAINAVDPRQTPTNRQNQYSAPRGFPEEEHQTLQNCPVDWSDENRAHQENYTWARSRPESSRAVDPGTRERESRLNTPESDDEQQNGVGRLMKRSSSSSSSISLFLDEDADREERGSPIAEIAERAKNESEASSENCLPFSIRNLNLDTPEALQAFLMSSCPKEAGTLECYVKRHKSGKSALFPEYRVYLKEGDVFLMTSRKRSNKKTSNYLISMARNDYHKSSDMIIGKLRANFVGTEFQIYDAGRNPKDTDPFFDERNDETVRSELGAVLYASNVIGSRGPRQMQVCINKVDEEGKSLKRWQPAHKDEEMIQCFKHRAPAAMRNLVVLENKTPKWNEQLGAYVLDFNGRVTQASVKNFILEEKGKGEKTILQFGRVAKDEFTLDFQWPLSPFQAFAIALSSCDSKIACD